jgi:hypothetical protein
MVASTVIVSHEIGRRSIPQERLHDLFLAATKIESKSTH